jgi:hypothetical protein
MPMPTGSRTACLALTMGLALIPLVSARGGETENWERLRSMPRERRVFLSEKLREFDSLAPEEKSAIRALDRKVEGLSAADQANYLAVLHRYHLWLQSLPEDQRNALKTIPPAERMAMVTKLRAETKSSSPRRTSPVFLQLADLDGPTPYELVQQIKFWFELPPDQRASIEKLDPVERQKQFADLARARGANFNPTRHLTKSEEDDLITKLESTHQLKNGLLQPHAKVDAKDATKQARVRKRLAENYHFIEHPPEAVDPDNLLRFTTALPSWFRPSFDPLPPPEARRRLTILYRLLYPHPKEITDKGPASPGTAPPKPKAPATPKAATAPSF